MEKKRDPKHDWVKTVTTDVVAVPKGTMTKSPREMARILLKLNTYPGAHGSINRYLQYYLNRGGKSIPKDIYANVRKAQEIIRSKKSSK